MKPWVPMSATCKIAVVCFNRLLRETIARLIAKRTEFELVSAGPSYSFADNDEGPEVDVWVLDSIDVVAGTPSTCHGTKVVLVAMEDNRDHFLEAIHLGVQGYVLRDASAADVVSAIRSVAQGEAACPMAYTKILFEYIAKLETSASVKGSAEWALTRREQQLIPLLASGQTNKEIANQLHVSEQTVKNHIYRMMRKTGAVNRLEIYDLWQSQLASNKNGRYWARNGLSTPTQAV